MNKDLAYKVGSCGQDNLIAKLFPPAMTFGVMLPAGAGLLKRGTVLCLNDDGSYSVCGASSEAVESAEGEDAAATTASGKPNCILADDVDATEEEAVGVAYRAGHFNRKALIVAKGYTMTIADEEELRKGGIYLTDMVD